MIASLAFEPSLRRVRRARFVPLAACTIEAASTIAAAMRDALAVAIGDGCALVLGEPVALDPAAWRSIAANALAFVVPGRATDVVFVLPERDARALIAAAFGEEPATATGRWTALEAGAIERIVARAAPACAPICGDPPGPVQAVDAARVPCVDFFDLRVAAPLRLTIGVGLTRAPATPPPARVLGPASLGAVPLALTAVLGRGVITPSRLLELRLGAVLPLVTKVAGEAELKVAGHRIASGSCGIRNGYAAFDVKDVSMRSDAK